MNIRRFARSLYLYLNGAHWSWRRFFLRSLRLNKNDIFMDLGGGTGVWTGILAPYVGMAILADREVSGYDQNFSKAKTFYLTGRSNCFPVKCDALALPFRPGTIDKILCSEVLEHIDNSEDAVKEVARVLKPGGKAAFTTPCASFINSYDFLISRWGRKLIPSFFQRSPFLKNTYEEYERLAGHVHRGFEVEDYKGFGDRNGLKLSSYEYSHKSLTARYYELQEGLLPLSLLFLPITRPLYILDRFLGGKGLNLLCAFEKYSKDIPSLKYAFREGG